MKTINYEINNNDLIMTEGVSFEEVLILNDREIKRVISQEQMFQDYFDTVYGVFLKRLKKLKDLKCEISEKDEKRLTNMLKDLIISNKNIYRNRKC